MEKENLKKKSNSNNKTNTVKKNTNSYNKNKAKGNNVAKKSTNVNRTNTKKSVNKNKNVIKKTDAVSSSKKQEVIANVIPKEVVKKVEEIKIDKLISKRKKDPDKYYKIFRIVSLIIIIFCTIYYSARFIYYYLDSHNNTSYVKEELINKLDKNVAISGNGLYIMNGKKIYKGDINNNYLFYKGIKWRIMSYDNDYIYMISNDSLSIIEHTNMDSWLKNIKNKYVDEYISDIYYLDSDTYNESINGNTYLNNNTFYYLSDNKYIDKDAKVNVYNDGIYSVRICAKLSKKVIALSGNGTINNSYIIQNKKALTVMDADIGEYVKYGNYEWRIIDKDSTSVKLALNDLLDDYIYSNNMQNYNAYDKTSLLYYLNNTFYNTLNKSKILKNSYNYITISNKVSQYNLNVGMYTLGDMFINDYNGYSIMAGNDDKTIYRVNVYGLLYLDMKSNKNKVRPVIKIDNKISISEGDGISSSPYVLGD